MRALLLVVLFAIVFVLVLLGLDIIKAHKPGGPQADSIVCVAADGHQVYRAPWLTVGPDYWQVYGYGYVPHAQRGDNILHVMGQGETCAIATIDKSKIHIGDTPSADSFTQ